MTTGIKTSAADVIDADRVAAWLPRDAVLPPGSPSTSKASMRPSQAIRRSLVFARLGHIHPGAVAGCRSSPDRWHRAGRTTEPGESKRRHRGAWLRPLGDLASTCPIAARRLRSQPGTSAAFVWPALSAVRLDNRPTGHCESDGDATCLCSGLSSPSRSERACV
jgi:hypothetical protein